MSILTAKISYLSPLVLIHFKNEKFSEKQAPLKKKKKNIMAENNPSFNALQQDLV